MCWARSISADKKGMMEFDNFTKVVKQFAPWAKTISLSGALGEPLLNPDLVDMIKYCKEIRMSSSVVTNATLLNEDLSREMLKAGVGEIRISIDGTTKDTYESIRIGAKFEKVIDNIQTLTELRKKLRAFGTIVGMQMTVMEKNLKEVPEMVKLANRLGVKELTIGGLNELAYPTREYLKSFKGETNVDVQTASVIFQKANQIAKDLNIALHIENFTPCDAIWVHTYVTWNGYVTPCCWAPDPEGINFGNVFEEKFSHIWNNQAYQNFRKAVYSKEPPLVCIGCPRLPSCFAYKLT
jgi:radical SAM protein with 4Fe4S-binding SPASM domain